jgi:hypothetical protein
MPSFFAHRQAMPRTAHREPALSELAPLCRAALVPKDPPGSCSKRLSRAIMRAEVKVKNGIISMSIVHTGGFKSFNLLRTNLLEFIESTNLMGLGQGRGVGGPAGGGGVGRGHTIGHGFIVGMLVGAAMTLYMTPECNDSSRSMHASTPNPSLSSSDTLPLASLLIADLHRCQAGLALEQNKRAILATNAAEVASRLEELRDEKGCDRACQQEVCCDCSTCPL